VAYLRGIRDFYGASFHVNRDVLIPRPETELLVDLALAAAPCGRLLDLGTGSGILAITLRRLFPAQAVVAVDVSAAALGVARGNAARLLGADHGIEFLEGDLFEPVAGTFSLIVSNPPYISQAEYACLEPNVRDYEPALALLAGEDGLAVVRRILADAREHLEPRGTLLVEVSPTTAAPALVLAGERGFQGKVERDLAGLDRVLVLVPPT
jgi:release factor glutamine methyltransferase